MLMRSVRWRYARRAAVVLVLAFAMAESGMAQQTSSVRRFSILVGINAYDEGRLLPLQKAQNDASDLGSLLQRQGFRTVKVMTGDKGRTDALCPTKRKILDQVENLAAIVGPDDQVVFFFSGHGVNQAGESYLLPIDTALTGRENSSSVDMATALGLQTEIIAPFERAGLKNLVVLVDACQKTLTRDKGLSVVGVDQVRSAGGAVVITATGPGKVSYEDPKGANGLFTKGLLAALDGAADSDRDGAVTVMELAAWLPKRVSEDAFAADLTQKPQVSGIEAAQGQPELVRVARSAASTASSVSGIPTTAVVAGAAPSAKAQFVVLKLPAGVTATITILDESGRQLQVLPDVSGSANPRLEPGAYKIQVQDKLYQYYAYEQTVTVADSKVQATLALRPNFGSLALTVDPADGADVFLNGEKKGSVTGGTLKLPSVKSGSYALVVSRDLYESKTQTVQIEDGKTAMVNLRLAPNFFTLALTIDKPATVYVDGVAKGPAGTRIQLPFRPVSVKLVPADSRYLDWTESLTPKAKGGMEQRNVTFAARQGTLIASTEPASDAVLSLTPVSGGKPVSIGIAPTEWTGLIGDYVLSARAAINGQSWTGSQRVTLREGQDTETALKLSTGPVAGASFTNGVGMTFVGVAGGGFTMGDAAGVGKDDEKPAHTVILRSFSMATTEVTQAQWQKVMGTNPSSFKGDTLPVENVSWYDAVAFCNKLSQKEGLQPVYKIRGANVTCDFSRNGYRLPTEAEWEYAAKGGPDQQELAIYAGSADEGEVAWFSGNGDEKGKNGTRPVAGKKANGLGLYDMSGNVWEWCNDWYGNYGSESQEDPVGAASGMYRVQRGGGWYSDVKYLRTSSRGSYTPDGRNSRLGFRVLLPAPQK